MSDSIPTLKQIAERVERHLLAQAAADNLKPESKSIDIYAKGGTRWWIDYDMHGKIRLGVSYSTGWDAIILPPDVIRPIRDALNQLLGESAADAKGGG